VLLLCVGGNVPFFDKMEDGHASDKAPITQLGAKTGVLEALGFEKTLILRG
jgi:hypothetical protein